MNPARVAISVVFTIVLAVLSYGSATMEVFAWVACGVVWLTVVLMEYRDRHPTADEEAPPR